MNLIRQCIKFREMLIAFTRRELRQRYVGSVIGWIWPFLQPVLMLGVYYVVFVRLLGIRLGADWAIELLGSEERASSFNIVLLCCGLVAWFMTAEFIVRSVNTVVENGGLVSKVAFPTELLPISLLAAYLINLLVLFSVFVGITWATTDFISPIIYLFPVVFFLHALFMLGLAYLLGTANVFVRDVNQLAPIAVNLWFFLTPIVYVEAVLAMNPDSEGWTWVFDWNPMAYLMDLYRWTLVVPAELRISSDNLVETVKATGAPPLVDFNGVLSHLAIFGAISIALFIVGYRTFMANKHKFADEI